MAGTYSLHNVDMKHLYAINDETGKRIVTMTLPHDASYDDWQVMAQAIRLFCSALGMIDSNTIEE